MNISIKNIGEFNIGDTKKSVNHMLSSQVNDTKTIIISKNSTVLRNKDSFDNIIEVHYKDNKLVSITVDSKLVDNIPDELISSDLTPDCNKFGIIDFNKITQDKCKTTGIDYCKQCSLLYTYFNRIEDENAIMIYKHTENLYTETVSLVDSKIDEYDDETFTAVSDTIFC